jgi:hypothetical protein
MRSTQQFSITLPNEMPRERATERWLLEQVGPAYDALKADPSRAVSADQLRARIAAEHQAATDKA